MEKDKKYYIFRLNMKTVNILAMIIFFVLYIFVKVVFKIDSLAFDKEVGLGVLIFLYFMWMILHEILHSIGYYLCGGKWDKIIYGMALEKGVFYCLCKQNIKRKNILISSMLPLIVIGIITAIIGIILNNNTLTLLSLFNISGAAGDIVTFLFINKLKNNVEFSEMDDELSFAIYADYDVSKKKHFGVDYIETKESIDRKELDKIKISKPSIYIMLVLLVLAILSIIFNI